MLCDIFFVKGRCQKHPEGGLPLIWEGTTNFGEKWGATHFVKEWGRLEILTWTGGCGKISSVFFWGDKKFALKTVFQLRGTLLVPNSWQLMMGSGGIAS